MINTVADHDYEYDNYYESLRYKYCYLTHDHDTFDTPKLMWEACDAGDAKCGTRQCVSFSMLWFLSH